MTAETMSPGEDELAAENAGLRRLLAQAGIDAAERTVAERLQRLLVEELHHRVKNALATVMAITSQSLRSAESLEQGRHAIESRLMALGRAHDLLLKASWAGASLLTVIRGAVEPYEMQGGARFVVRGAEMQVARVRSWPSPWSSTSYARMRPSTGHCLPPPATSRLPGRLMKGRSG